MSEPQQPTAEDMEVNIRSFLNGHRQKVVGRDCQCKCCSIARRALAAEDKLLRIAADAKHAADWIRANPRRNNTSHKVEEYAVAFDEIHAIASGEEE